MDEAAELWEIDAIKVDVSEPFTLTSGNRSPIYIDCRKIIAYPRLFKRIVECFEALADQLEFDVVAGGVTAGVPFAAWLAWTLDKPLAYIRPNRKGFGSKRAVEGVIEDGNRVLLVEDLITDGGSKLSFIDSIRKNGAEITDCLVVFDREQGGVETLASAGVKLHSLFTLSGVLGYGAERGRISESDAREVGEYLESPEGWHEKRGFGFSTR